MTWYKLSQSATDPQSTVAQVSVSTEAYERSVWARVQQILNYGDEKRQRLQTYTPNIANIQSVLAKYNYPSLPQLMAALQSGNGEQVEEFFLDLSQFHRNISKQMGWQGTDDLWTVYKELRDFVEHAEMQAPEYEPYSMQQAQTDLAPLLQQTRANMQKIAQNIQEAISRISQWHGTPVLVEASAVDKDWNVFSDAMDYATIELAPTGDGMNPNFTYFQADGKVEIDDILEAGDTDFFTDPKAQSDYFNLVKEIRSPGSTGKGGKVLALYTARPYKDRRMYMEAQEVPSGLFLTNRYDSALGLASDLQGGEPRRDVWKIRIDSRYLVQTLDGMEKQYQIVGDGMVPVYGMTLVDEGGPSEPTANFRAVSKNWYGPFRSAQSEGLWGQDPNAAPDPAMAPQPLFDQNALPQSQINQGYSDNMEEDLETMVASPEAIYELLDHYGVPWEYVEFTTGTAPIISLEWEGTQYVISDLSSPSLTEANEFVSSADPSMYITPLDFNKDFWESPPQFLYHGTQDEYIPDIMREGLEPRDETRGISNRHTGAAVFTSLNEEYAEYHYGTAIEINVAAMKADGYTPDVGQEGPLEEAELYDALAHKLGLEEYQHETEHGLDPDTVVIYGPIPPKYLRVLGNQMQASVARKMKKAEGWYGRLSE